MGCRFLWRLSWLNLPYSALFHIASHRLPLDVSIPLVYSLDIAFPVRRIGRIYDPNLGGVVRCGHGSFLTFVLHHPIAIRIQTSDNPNVHIVILLYCRWVKFTDMSSGKGVDHAAKNPWTLEASRTQPS